MIDKLQKKYDREYISFHKTSIVVSTDKRREIQNFLVICYYRNYHLATIISIVSC